MEASYPKLKTVSCMQTLPDGIVMTILDDGEVMEMIEKYPTGEHGYMVVCIGRSTPWTAPTETDKRWMRLKAIARQRHELDPMQNLSRDDDFAHMNA